MEKIITYCFLFAFLIFTNCNNGTLSQEKNNVKYYATFVGYSHPVKLVDELDSKSINERRSYYIAYYKNNKS